MESQDKHLNREGQLFIVATPIGNLGDITFRAAEILREADVIAVEDTRVSGRLLAHLGISTPMMICHEHNEEKAAAKIIHRLSSGERVALISDAGTPLINDPGYRLVKAVRDAGFKAFPIPGASSPIAALSASGLPTDHFTYAGFFPRSGKSRTELILQIEKAKQTYVLLESPRRLVKTLEALQKANMGGREVCVARELTKLHETFVCGSLDEVLTHFREDDPRGEIVLLIGPNSGTSETTDGDLIKALESEAMQALSPSRRAGAVAKQYSVTKSRVYALLLDREKR
ncbi:MAG: 16S rRNA (cytidine(1402)-2'-O)-methyltransferase [Mariprofundaceae bacterium]